MWGKDSYVLIICFFGTIWPLRALAFPLTLRSIREYIYHDISNTSSACCGVRGGVKYPPRHSRERGCAAMSFRGDSRGILNPQALIISRFLALLEMTY
jgi:hypothetical protein